jgi:hypothetical protein
MSKRREDQENSAGIVVQRSTVEILDNAEQSLERAISVSKS